MLKRKQPPISADALAAEAYLRENNPEEFHKQKLVDVRERSQKHADRRRASWNIALGALFTLIGVGIGIGSSVYVTKKTNQSFSDRTQRDFLHNQQASAFSAYLQTASKAFQELNNIGYALATAQAVVTVAQYNAMVARADSVVISVKAGEATIRIFTDETTTVRSAATRLRNDTLALFLVSLDLVECGKKSFAYNGGAGCANKEKKYNDAADATEADLDTFADAARAVVEHN